MGGEGIRFPLEVDTMDSIAALGGTEAALESVTAAAERTADATRNAIPIAPAALSAGQSLNVMTGGLRLAGVQTGVLSVAMRAATLSTGLLAGGIKGIGVAVKTTLASIPVLGWAILAVAVAVTALMTVLGQNKKALEEQKKAYDAAQKSAKEYADYLKVVEGTRERDMESHYSRLSKMREGYAKATKQDVAASLEAQKRGETEQIDGIRRGREAAYDEAQKASVARVAAGENEIDVRTAFRNRLFDINRDAERDVKAVREAGAQDRKKIASDANEALLADAKGAQNELRRLAMTERERELDDEATTYSKGVDALNRNLAERVAAGNISAEQRKELEQTTNDALASLLSASIEKRRKINKDADEKEVAEKEKTADRLLAAEKERRTDAVRNASEAAQAEFDVQRESLAAQLEAAQAQQAAIREAMPEFKAQFVGIAEMQKRIQAAAGGMKAPEEVAAIQKRMEKTQAEIKELDKRAEQARKDTITAVKAISTTATFT